MSWIPVDFTCVRYSSIEGTHYFIDPRYPSTIQFVVSSKWESFDVSFVKHHALDGEIRRLAEDAERRLVQDSKSGYQPWPSFSSSVTAVQPSAPGHGHVDSMLARNTQSPHSFTINTTTPTSQSFSEAQKLHAPSNPAVPTTGIAVDLKLPAILASSAPLSQSVSYESPYGQRARASHSPASISASATTPTSIVAPSQAVTSKGATHASPQQYAVPPPLLEGTPRTTATMPTATTPTTSPTSNGTQQEAPNHVPGNYNLKPAAAPSVILSRSRETKILLSIDGDGVRGLSSLLIVESLVNAICVKVNQRLDAHQIFDLTGGSSLGGILAILLCRLQMQPHRAREAYKRISKQVFADKRAFFASLDPHTPSTVTNAKTLEDEIKSVISQELGNADELLLDGREDAGDVFVVSTHIEIGSNKAALMRSYATRRITGPELDTNMPIWKAMKATAVAPRYMSRNDTLPRYQRYVIEPGLVDHGTAKNNPVRDILYECRKLFRYTNDMMIIVSIGTGIGLNRAAELPEMISGVEDRQSEARASADKFQQEFKPLMDRNWMKYFRFNVPGLDDVPLEEWAHEDKIRQKTSAYLAQPDVGRSFYACVDAITALLLGPPGR